MNRYERHLQETGKNAPVLYTGRKMILRDVPDGQNFIFDPDIHPHAVRGHWRITKRPAANSNDYYILNANGTAVGSEHVVLL